MVTRDQLIDMQARRMGERGPGGLESALSHRIVEIQRQYGEDAIRTSHTHISKNSPAGWPDDAIGSHRHRRVIFRELKKCGGKPTVAQQEWLDILGALPGLGDGPGRVLAADLWTPVDWFNGRIDRELLIVAGILPLPRVGDRMRPGPARCEACPDR
jgi:hypothetical protein